MNQYSEARVFTTGQVAEICQVAPRTVSKWFDSGRLKGYRIPGSQDRRIPRESLVEFMRAHGMPLGPLAEKVGGRVLLVGVPSQESADLKRVLDLSGLEHETAITTFEAGHVAQSMQPHCVVIDSSLGLDQSVQISKYLHSLHQPHRVFTVLVFDGRSEDVVELPFDDRFRRPYDAALLAVRIRSLVELAQR